MEPLDHLFRRESGRIVAALTRIFGVEHLALVEDVVQEALCRALETWKVHGAPANPRAWLLATAKNCALDALRRDRTARTFAPEVARFLDEGASTDELASEASMTSDQLRMMFSCCHPCISEEAQVALVLHILCGFSVAEVASAFLTPEETIKKRITRAKAQLAATEGLFELTDDAFVERLSSVQRALYLLFNEGYHGASAEAAVRAELCDEAMRLGALLCAHAWTARPTSYALLALMCLHAARLPARLDAAGDFTLLLEQDRGRWDRGLIAEGLRLMDLSAHGSELSAYHVEAAIASVHAAAAGPDEIHWPTVVELYDVLMRIRPSPVVALNRALAIAQRDGADSGLAELHAIADRERLRDYPFYAAALGELELRRGRRAAARGHFETALGLARNPTERRLLMRRLAACGDGERDGDDGSDGRPQRDGGG
jgi:RNA polymerase sigma factor (sigma-70 family)